MPIDFNGLDTAVHGPLRLGVLTALHLDGALDFSALKARLQAADGSLSMHLRRLEEAGYVTAKKGFVARRPKTTYRLTAAGRRALAEYLATMRRLLDAVDRTGDRDAPETGGTSDEQPRGQ